MSKNILPQFLPPKKLRIPEKSKDPKPASCRSENSPIFLSVLGLKHYKSEVRRLKNDSSCVKSDALQAVDMYLIKSFCTLSKSIFTFQLKKRGPKKMAFSHAVSNKSKHFINIFHCEFCSTIQT